MLSNYLTPHYCATRSVAIDIGALANYRLLVIPTLAIRLIKQIDDVTHLALLNLRVSSAFVSCRAQPGLPVAMTVAPLAMTFLAFRSPRRIDMSRCDIA